MKNNNLLIIIIVASCLFGIMTLVPKTGNAQLVILDGDLVRNPEAEGMAQFDIYIVKLVNNKKFKRLILSPHVFESYGHFDKNGNSSPWDDVINVDQELMDGLVNSNLVRDDGDEKVYKLSAQEGSDTGVRQWLDMTTETFNDLYDSDSIYTINHTDFIAYTIAAYTICEEYTYSTCPEDCQKRCLPSACDGDNCTADCDGPGSCY